MTNDNQPTLPGITDPRPAEIVTRNDHEFDQAMTRIKAANARVLGLEVLRGCNSGWRIRVHWPQPMLDAPNFQPCTNH